MGENEKGSAATVSGTPRSLISLKSIEKPCKSRPLQKETGHQSRYTLYQNWCPVMVEVTGLEPVHILRIYVDCTVSCHISCHISFGFVSRIKQFTYVLLHFFTFVRHSMLVDVLQRAICFPAAPLHDVFIWYSHGMQYRRLKMA